MHYPRKMFNMGSIGFPEVKLTEIAKLANLKILSLFLCNLDKTGPNSILELMGFLPQLQELDLNFRNCELTEDGATKRFPTTSPCLRTLKLSIIDLGNGIELSYAFQMITSFPNLQTLEITASYQDAAPIPGIYSSEVDYNTTWLLQLRSVVFKNSKGSENEVCLIKYLLAYSPFLKKFVICLHSRLHSHLLCDEKFMFSTTLLKLHRASPVVDIHLY
ncbi:hypothetical protein L1987_57320 [Smallanthus sonchifolius]|uniref:Uncharacterized protein n=1 Tax=Smallanthus sonchifolius TaxID=185202 RepID=A0ACB9DCY2_9ASTR|nr:hypothetical protein L1987_87035 [Smallanthus sonchifolius]KAI3744243.1 hypothetical protein L1987_57320 [Smallanthus sonchifolius]